MVKWKVPLSAHRRAARTLRREILGAWQGYLFCALLALAMHLANPELMPLQWPLLFGFWVWPAMFYALAWLPREQNILTERGYRCGKIAVAWKDLLGWRVVLHPDAPDERVLLLHTSRGLQKIIAVGLPEHPQPIVDKFRARATEDPALEPPGPPATIETPSLLIYALTATWAFAQGWLVFHYVRREQAWVYFALICLGPGPLFFLWLRKKGIELPSALGCAAMLQMLSAVLAMLGLLFLSARGAQ